MNRISRTRVSRFALCMLLASGLAVAGGAVNAGSGGDLQAASTRWDFGRMTAHQIGPWVATSYTPRLDIERFLKSRNDFGYANDMTLPAASRHRRNQRYSSCGPMILLSSTVWPGPRLASPVPGPFVYPPFSFAAADSWWQMSSHAVDLHQECSPIDPWRMRLAESVAHFDGKTWKTLRSSMSRTEWREFRRNLRTADLSGDRATETLLCESVRESAGMTLSAQAQ